MKCLTSRLETYRIVVAGDEELGYSLCAKLLNRDLADPRSLAKESLSEPWPEDEWTKLVTFSQEGKFTTVELDLELHGPWVWELYETLQPKDYFSRFSGVVLCANPDREHLPAELSNLMDSVNLHVGRQLPTIMIVDRSRRLVKGQIANLRSVAESLEVPIFFVRLSTGENIVEAFKHLASEVYALDES
ncbi:hypothetical protein EU546_00190 [Candidatus Thorarchaeota archaeon]|nr:MAG: hypothetical protein EU546_00190 [Candidatus Thorarchaeota archaeon]